MSTSTEYAIDFKEVLRNTGWQKVFSLCDTKGMRQASETKLRGPCPFCYSPKDFSATEKAGRDGQGLFHCFKCKASGDALEFVSLSRGNPPKHRSAYLGIAKELAGNSRNSTPPSRTVPNSTPSQDHPGLHRIAESLKADHEALAPFELDPETLRHFGAGWKIAGSLGGTLAVPIHTAAGELRAYCGYSPDMSLAFHRGFARQDYVFNAHRIEEGELRVLEDVLAVLRAYEGGETNTVCFLTETVGSEQLQALIGLMDDKGCVWVP